MKTNKLPKINETAERFVARIGFDTSNGIRYEPGDDVPADVVSAATWLLTHQVVKKVEQEASK